MPELLSLEEFKESLRLSPRLVVELVIEETNGKIALVKRTDAPFEGYWHLPGGFLLKGESLSDCAVRIAKKEVGLDINGKESKFLGLFENIDSDPRGHLLHYVTKVKVNDVPAIGGLRLVKTLPEDTIPHQKKFLQELGYR